MARRRRPEPQAVEMEPPEWLWQFRRSDPQWRREGDGGPEGDWIAAELVARRRWRVAVREWLDERDLEEWGHFHGSWAAFKQLQQQEPHRVLRHPEA